VVSTVNGGRRLPGSRVLWRAATVVGTCVVLAACGSDDSARKELMALVDAGEYGQVRAEAERLRQSGVLEPWLDYADGLAALHEGDEEDARRLLESVVQRDRELAAPIAKAWADAARVDHEAGWRERATVRMTEAVLADPSVDLDPMLPAVASYLYRVRKDYDAAWPLFERLVTTRPEPASRVPEWVYRWGHLHELRGDLDGARQIYESFIAEFPADKDTGRFVHWRYCDVLIEQARQARESGDQQKAIDLLGLVLEDGWHVDQQQRAEFVFGQILEAQGRPDLARPHYDRVVQFGEIIETEVVDDARQRLEALDAQNR